MVKTIKPSIQAYALTRIFLVYKYNSTFPCFIHTLNTPILYYNSNLPPFSQWAILQ
jgi:hypothetical protein